MDPWCNGELWISVQATGGSIPRQVEMFINLKCSFRMRPWESLHA